MPAARRSADPYSQPATQDERSSLALASAEARPAANPVLDQHLRLASAFGAETHQAGYPGAVKLAILLGAPTALWSGVIVAGAWILHRFG